MEKLKVLELFGGIGACSKALEKLGVDYEIADYVEIDKYAVKSFNAMHGTNFEPQDICEWDKDIKVDLIMHGSPCQDFSVAGKQAGGDENSGTRSSLMYETIKIVEKLKPKYIIWENVKNVISKKHIHNFNNYIDRMSKLGYTSYYQVLNAKDYGIPQNRERVFTISIRKDINKNYIFPSKQELKLKLRDMLEENVDKKYYLSDELLNYFYNNSKQQKEKGNGFEFKPTDGYQQAKSITTREGTRMTDNFIKETNIVGKIDKWHERGIIYNENGQIGTLKATDYKTPKLVRESILKGYSDYSLKKIENNIVKSDIVNTITANAMQSFNHNNCHLIGYPKIRKLTPKECWRLMGFDDEDFEKACQVNSNTQLYKQAGNSIVVNVLEAILKELL